MLLKVNVKITEGYQELWGVWDFILFPSWQVNLAYVFGFWLKTLDSAIRDQGQFVIHSISSSQNTIICFSLPTGHCDRNQVMSGHAVGQQEKNFEPRDCKSFTISCKQTCLTFFPFFFFLVGDIIFIIMNIKKNTQLLLCLRGKHHFYLPRLFAFIFQYSLLLKILEKIV